MAAEPTDPDPPPAVNVAVVSGYVARAPEKRDTRAGRLVTFELVTDRPAGSRPTTAPVAWLPALPWAEQIRAGDRLMAVGQVRRRFFRAGGSTASRTELVAQVVVPLPSGQAAAEDGCNRCTPRT